MSVRTLLRVLRGASLPSSGPVRVLSVDDWARRRGRTYGTLLLNLETHSVCEILHGREAALVAAWLCTHPKHYPYWLERPAIAARNYHRSDPSLLWADPPLPWHHHQAGVGARHVNMVVRSSLCFPSIGASSHPHKP